MGWKTSSRSGFSLTELMVVVALAVILMAIAIPTFNTGGRGRVNTAASQVREALQTARLRSIAVNRALQVRFNCPSAGRYRIVEAGWPDDGRCDETRYPYPAPSNAAYQNPPMPRWDGPGRQVHSRVTLSAAEPGLVVQFSPDGRAMKFVGGATQLIGTLPITVSADGYQRTVTVNSLGKVQTQQ
jgi:prepilin-type N-terminal cleavage/methylation domain-containing protein